MLKKPLLIFLLVGLMSFIAAFSILALPTMQEPSPVRALWSAQTETAGRLSPPPAISHPTQAQPESTHPPQHPRTAINQKKLDYADWRSELRFIQGPVKETLAELDAKASPEGDYMAANLLHMCYLRQQNPPSDAATEGYPPRSECLELGVLSQENWVERMKAAADAGLAAAQVTMAIAENPNPPLSPDEPDPWLDMQRDYIDKAASQCHPGAYVIRANYRFDPDNPQLQNQAAYTDFYTAELIYRQRFEGAPSLEKLLEQERQKLYQHQILEAENQALINYHKACTQ
ncbi:hypothetical protein [Ectopseudomonas khazarica]|uniref:hypothetical protein n=1 Tax=Ectopseudomonas khazarica TaxID=2502979 RepID=UPI002FE27726